MKRIHTALGAALLASSMIGGVAVAGDKADKTAGADKTEVVPSREDLNPNPASVEKMDANVQRQHDKDRDGNTSQPDTASGASGGSAAAGGGETRDWDQVDTNNDNLIQPEEMEAALKAAGPQAGQQR